MNSSHNFNQDTDIDSEYTTNINEPELGRKVERDHGSAHDITCNTGNTVNKKGVAELIIDRDFGYIPAGPKKSISLPENGYIAFKNNAQWLK